MNKPTPEEIAMNVSGMLNAMGNHNAKEFIKVMGNEHRTLQQRFTQLCFDWLQHCDTMMTDGRNEASKEIAKKIFDHLEKEEISFNRKYMLPFI